DTDATLARPRGKAKSISFEEVRFRDKVYRHWLAGLLLYDDHKGHLLARGLSADAIEFYGYRSLSPGLVRQFNRSVFQQFGQKAATVPGFPADRRCVVEEGIVVPVRNEAGCIIACEVRHMVGRLKYTWLSGGGGPSSGTPPHVPKGTPTPSVEVRVTEG